MEPAEYAAALIRQHGNAAIDCLLKEIEQAIVAGDDAQALYLDAALQRVEAMSGDDSALSA